MTPAPPPPIRRWSTSCPSSQSKTLWPWARPATTFTKCVTPRACGDASVAASAHASATRALVPGLGRERPSSTVHLLSVPPSSVCGSFFLVGTPFPVTVPGGLCAHCPFPLQDTVSVRHTPCLSAPPGSSDHRTGMALTAPSPLSRSALHVETALPAHRPCLPL